MRLYNLRNLGPKVKRTILFSIASALVISSFAFIFYKTIIASIISFFFVILMIFIILRVRITLKRNARIKRIEDVFPDFLQLMSSNLRAGMTIDRALLLSSRPEFNPLDKEILKTGRDLTVGKNMERALIDLGARINSNKISKIVSLINSGISSGGNLAILLDETSRGMRERDVLEKKAASNVLMYVIFIFLTVSIFSPALFALSSTLVEILTNIFSGIPDTETTVNIPFTLSKINVSLNFILYFSVIFIIVIDIFSALILGLVNKGDEKEGFRYILPIMAISLSIFFISKIILSNFITEFF